MVDVLYALTFLGKENGIELKDIFTEVKISPYTKYLLTYQSQDCYSIRQRVRRNFFSRLVVYPNFIYFLIKQIKVCCCTTVLVVVGRIKE